MGRNRKKRKWPPGYYYGRQAVMATYGKSVPMPKEKEPSLGNASAHEGEVVGTRKEGHLIVARQIEPCTCGGENEHCFRCNGTGYYVREIVLGQDLQHSSTKVRSSGQTPLAGFARDSRAGSYSIREKGRFDSRPDHDDFDDESKP